MYEYVEPIQYDTYQDLKDALQCALIEDDDDWLRIVLHDIPMGDTVIVSARHWRAGLYEITAKHISVDRYDVKYIVKNRLFDSGVWSISRMIDKLWQVQHAAEDRYVSVDFINAHGRRTLF